MAKTNTTCKQSLESCGLHLVFVRQVRGCALRVPAQSLFIPNPRHPSIASPAVTCFAVPACRQNLKGWRLPVYQHPVTSSVLPATGLPRAVTLYVCIGDLRGQERRTACCIIIMSGISKIFCHTVHFFFLTYTPRLNTVLLCSCIEVLAFM